MRFPSVSTGQIARCLMMLCPSQRSQSAQMPSSRQTRHLVKATQQGRQSWHAPSLVGQAAEEEAAVRRAQHKPPPLPNHGPTSRASLAAVRGSAPTGAKHHLPDSHGCERLRLQCAAVDRQCEHLGSKGNIENNDTQSCDSQRHFSMCEAEGAPEPPNSEHLLPISAHLSSAPQSTETPLKRDAA